MNTNSKMKIQQLLNQQIYSNPCNELKNINYHYRTKPIPHRLIQPSIKYNSQCHLSKVPIKQPSPETNTFYSPFQKPQCKTSMGEIKYASNYQHSILPQVKTRAQNASDYIKIKKPNTLTKSELDKSSKQVILGKNLNENKFNLMFKEYSEKRNKIEQGFLTTRHFFQILKPKCKRLKWDNNKASVIDYDKIELNNKNQLKLANYFLNEKGTVKEKAQAFDLLIERCVSNNLGESQLLNINPEIRQDETLQEMNNIDKKNASQMLGFLTNLKTYYMKKRKLIKKQKNGAQLSAILDQPQQKL